MYRSPCWLRIRSVAHTTPFCGLHATPQPAGTIGRPTVTTLVDTFNCKYEWMVGFLAGGSAPRRGQAIEVADRTSIAVWLVSARIAMRPTFRSIVVTERPVVIVTGASKGIGAEMALTFAKAGFDVGVNYHHDEAGASQTVAKCVEHKARAFALQADVSDPVSVEAMFTACDEALGPVSCLVNNAGIIGGATTLSELRPANLQATFATNVFGAIYCLQEAVQRMRSDRGGRGGATINVSSIAATLGSPGEYVHYAASKAAVETLTIGAAKELGPLGIRVAAIRVGTTATDLHQREGNPDRPEKIAKATPLGRIAQPRDIAQAALWLGSPEASFVSGTVLTVAGAFTP